MILKCGYSNYISLGHFCSVAMELERYGLRSASFPFDWLITDFSGIVKSVNDHFVGFFDISLYEQSKKRLYVYRNKELNFEFVHDFSKYKPLSEQFKEFEQKYNRRIQRFYNEIKKPTLFIRYIKDQLELEFIESNIDYVISTFKRYNDKSEILFVANTNLKSSIIELYHVTPDENDVVARSFIQKEVSLRTYFLKCIIPNKEQNLKRYNSKNTFVKKNVTQFAEKL